MPDDRSIGSRRTFRKGIDIWQPEFRGDRIYFLERGEVAIFTGDAQGHDLLLQVVHPPQPFGEVCLCAEGAGLRNTFARAATEVVVIEVLYDRFLQYVQATPHALMSLLCTFSLRVSDCETRTEVLAHRGAQERIGRLLLQLAKKVPTTVGRAHARPSCAQLTPSWLGWRR
ncbi:MAG: Crp/Fnr family transcriptional regulator [Acidobacteria bacterium]|nr:Crp/Fnr family transcriptional regulator [Acidobacteriota bacterium]